MKNLTPQHLLIRFFLAAAGAVAMLVVAFLFAVAVFGCRSTRAASAKQYANEHAAPQPTRRNE